MKRKVMLDINVMEKNAHSVLECLAESLDASCFAIHFASHDNPQFRAGILSRYSATFTDLVLYFVEIKGKLVEPERRIALCEFSAVYGKSSAQFKPNSIMTVECFARSLGIFDQLPKIEAMFCNELLSAMSMHLDKDPMWRIWNGMKWVEIDPWKFVVEMDLNSTAA